PQQRADGDQGVDGLDVALHFLAQPADQLLADAAGVPGLAIASVDPMFDNLAALARQNPEGVPVALDDKNPHHQEHDENGQKDTTAELDEAANLVEKANQRYHDVAPQRVRRCRPTALPIPRSANGGGFAEDWGGWSEEWPRSDPVPS